ncbi:MAG: glutamine amidotransferase [Chloroflexi bacterium]|nr:glutamine amidotransferase [Chloroflexota bacterium]
MRLTIAHLYADLMNLYADRGNIICLRQRCQWRGIECSVVDVDLGDAFDPAASDLVFVGGGQDKEQRLAADDLARVKGPALRAAIEDGVAALAVCGGYQLFGHEYRPAEGDPLPGVGIFDLVTIHKGLQVHRCIGNIVVAWEGSTLVGFENHGGRTYLGAGCRPLGRVLTGFGNNAEDGTEGAVYRRAYGTYLHGSVLPKNPHFADHLIREALARRYGDVQLPPIDDSMEHRAHDAAVARARRSR